MSADQTRSTPSAAAAPPVMDDLPLFLTIRQTAYALDESGTPERIHSLIKRRLLRATKIGRETFVYTSSVRELRAARAVKSAI